MPKSLTYRNLNDAVGGCDVSLLVNFGAPLNEVDVFGRFVFEKQK